MAWLCSPTGWRWPVGLENLYATFRKCYSCLCIEPLCGRSISVVEGSSSLRRCLSLTRKLLLNMAVERISWLFLDHPRLFSPKSPQRSVEITCRHTTNPCLRRFITWGMNVWLADHAKQPLARLPASGYSAKSTLILVLDSDVRVVLDRWGFFFMHCRLFLGTPFFPTGDFVLVLPPSLNKHNLFAMAKKFS
jgi:hypothetical protein